MVRKSHGFYSNTSFFSLSQRSTEDSNLIQQHNQHKHSVAARANKHHRGKKRRRKPKRSTMKDSWRKESVEMCVTFIAYYSHSICFFFFIWFVCVCVLLLLNFPFSLILLMLFFRIDLSFARYGYKQSHHNHAIYINDFFSLICDMSWYVLPVRL